jgi:hypothetical protein
MSDIRTTIAAAVSENIGQELADQYASTIDYVTEKLVEREQEIADNIITTLSSVEAFKFSAEMVENAVRESGLAVRPGVQDKTEPTSVEDRLRIVESQVAQLMQVGRKLAPSEF